MRREGLLPALAQAAALAAGFLIHAPAPAVQASAVQAPAGPEAAAMPSSFERGLEAYLAGDFEGCLESMMGAVMEGDQPGLAREYIRLSGKRLVDRDRRDISAQRRELLREGRALLKEEKRKAVRWTTWLRKSRVAADRERWVEAFDWARRVTEENPLHEEAQEAQAVLRRSMAKHASQGSFRDRKETLLYSAMLAYLAGSREEARAQWTEALEWDSLEGEIDDERIRHYLAALPAAQAPPAALPPAPPPALVAAAPEPKPALPAPGEWSYSHGMAKAREGRWAEAVELLEQALSEAPEHPRARKDLVEARMKLSEQAAAGRARAKELYMAGIMSYGQGRLEDALTQWRAAVQADPGHVYAHKAIQHVEKELEARGTPSPRGP
ncbi:MAG: hypothetical protein HY924_08400 [Elusimicrobia bacterium]|nr:hypothetical protein [Elusimicrobiota bacterium]